MLSQLSQAWHSWKNAKAVALLATLALAVGIGSTTAIFSVVEAVLLRPLLYEHGERFVALFASRLNDPSDHSGLSYADLLDYQRRARSFDVFGWFRYAGEDVNMAFRGHPEHVNALPVTPALVNQLGVALPLGRWFRNPVSDVGGYNVAVLSDRLWRRLGSDPAIVGKPVVVNGKQFTVLGVTPPSFHFPLVGVVHRGDDNDLWIPLDPRGQEQDHNNGIYISYARLRPGVTIASARAEIKRIAAQIARDDPAHHPFYTARLDSLRDSAVSEVRPALLLLFAAAGLLFLITCANVAGLLLARSIARARETAIRVALGATRGQLAWLFFLEGLIISLAGAVLGIGVCSALVRLILSVASEYDPFSSRSPINSTVLLFAFLSALVSSALFSLAPLWQALRTTPNAVLTSGLRASASARTRKLSQSLVVAEIALASTLLAVSALFVAQLAGLYRVSPGFDTNHLLTFQLTADPTQVHDHSTLVAYQERLLHALDSIPGVSGVAFTNQLPLAGCCFSARIYPDGLATEPKVAPDINILGVSASYFNVMRIPLERGRFLNAHDTNDKLLAVVIDQAAALRFFPKRDAIGAYGHFGTANGDRFQVVGIVGDVRNKGLSDLTVPEIYLISGLLDVNPMYFVARSSRSAASLLPDLRRAILNVDRTQPIYDIRTMSQVVQTSLSLQRVNSLVMIVFASVALLLATLGVYGVVSYSVRQRTVEFGTRMALGAQNRDLLRLVLGNGFHMGAFGLAIGAVSVAAATWFLLHLTTLIQNVEALPFVYSALLIAAVVCAASFFPAWRASLLSPMVAIRDESESLWQNTRRSLALLLRGSSDSASIPGLQHSFANATLLSEFVQATRHAATFDDALRIALSTLRDKIGAASAMLLENASGLEYECVAAVPQEVACSSLPLNGFLSNRLRFYSLPLPFTAPDVATWTRWATENRPQLLPELYKIAETRASVAVPLRTKTEILGLLLVGQPLARPAYNSLELRLLNTCAEQFALMLENARLTSRVVEQEKLRRDVALAAEVQKRLLPERSPDTAAASLSAFSIPARSVGGDYYDFLDVGNHRIGIALADIAGKGVAAALLMSVVQASLRIVASEEGISLPQLAARMNRYLYRSTGSNGYATFFYAQLDEESRQLRYVNAGHNPPFLLRSANGHTPETDIEELAAGGIVIGMFPQARYEEAAINLESGDVLIAFTDGVTEALNPSEEEFGEDRLKALLREVAHLPVQEMSATISRELRAWISNADQHDDLTFIVMKVN